MISGEFGENGELFFEIELIADNGEFFPIEVLLDTGFTKEGREFESHVF